MTPTLRESLDKLARWHEKQARDYAVAGLVAQMHLHAGAASDLRSALIQDDDATKNMLILQAHKAKDRRFSGESITGFGELPR